MARGVKGSGPQKDKAAEVVEEDGVLTLAHPDVPEAGPEPTTEGVEFPSEEEEQEEFDKGIEEFNTHVKALVKNFFEQEVAGLEERIRDLEQIVGRQQFGEFEPGPPVPQPTRVYQPPSVVVEEYGSTSTGRVEEYSPAHQGGDGTPWYRP